MAFLDTVGLAHLVTKLKNLFALKDHTHSAATTGVAGLMSAADKSKLDGITASADSVAVTKSLTSGTKVGTITVNGTAYDLYAPTNTDTTYSNATTSAAGLMSAADKSKLDGIATGANAYTHPTTSGNKHIPSGGSSGQILRWSADGTAAWGADNNTTYSAMTGATTSAAGTSGLVPAPAKGSATRYLRSDGTWTVPPDTNTTYSAATTSAAGLMSAADKSKLDGITASADSVAVTRSLTSGTKVGTITVNGTAYDLYAPNNTDTTYSNATTSAAGLMSATDKSKLDGIATGANAYTHPSYTARTGVPTANQTPKFGGTFTVTQPVSDSSGHITAMNSRTITIPSAAATTSAAGLMSAADKTSLESLKTRCKLVTGTFNGLGWTKQSDGTYTQTVTVSGVTASNRIFVSPAAAYEDTYLSMGCEAISQAANSITFSCHSPSDTAVVVEVIILDL